MDFKKMKVAEVMSTDVVSALAGDTIDKIEESMQEHRIQHIPVTDSSGGVIGIISKSDILLLKDWGVRLGLSSSVSRTDRLLHSNTAHDIMTKDVVTVSPGATLEECAALLKKYFCHSLPVVKDGKLVGMISSFDLIQTVYLK